MYLLTFEEFMSQNHPPLGHCSIRNWDIRFSIFSTSGIAQFEAAIQTHVCNAWHYREHHPISSSGGQTLTGAVYTA